MGDHDSLFKLIFDDAVHAAGELRTVLPPEVIDALDLDALRVLPGSFVDPDLSQRHVDLLFSAPRRADGARVLVYFLVEHQSEPDPLMPWRVLTYLQRIWAALLRAEPDRRSLPPIIPLVVHHGAGGWTSPRTLHELIEGLDELPALRRYVPTFHLLIDDLAGVTDEALRARPLPSLPRVALWLLRDARAPEEFLAHLGAWTDILRETLAQAGVAQIDILLRYTLRVAGRESFDAFYQTIIDIASPEERSMLTAAQSYYDEGREHGLREGHERGLRDGHERGLRDGHERGLRDALAQLLTRRFGPLDVGARERLTRADLVTLERWLPRVLSAASLADALADE